MILAVQDCNKRMLKKEIVILVTHQISFFDEANNLLTLVKILAMASFY
jgi:hypothetical protein